MPIADEQDRLMYTALLSVGIIAVVEIMGRTELDSSLTVALYCFSVATPFLTATILIFHDISVANRYVQKWYVRFLEFTGVLATLAGLGAIFWHFSMVVGLLFIVCSILGFIFWAEYDNALKKM